ncbi:hypothetical protein [Haloarchaeobius sp. HRN-SO-5]|uniref:hypothetical protein n=1 Tax=Haloarchaeobius sp. HRN-SO-5 TaxID=3446118 RepID=UPI003EBF548E
MMSVRYTTGWHEHVNVHTVRAMAGVADQDSRCENGSEGCPGPNSDTGAIPCWQCMVQGGDSS